jgi:tetratricopeptide (TPR) repeat protein
MYLALGAMMLGAYEQARQYLDSGMTVCRTFGLLRGEMTMLISAAQIDLGQGRLGAARYGFEAVWRIARSIGAQWGEAIAENELGNMARREGMYGEADERLGRALHLFREMGNTLKEASTLQRLGWLHSDIGNFATAHAWFDQAQSVMRTINAPEIEADMELGVACLALAETQHTCAVEYAERGLQRARTIKNKAMEADALIVVGHARNALHQPQEARVVYEQALNLCAELARKAAAAEAHAGLAVVSLKDGDCAAALDHVEGILSLRAKDEPVGLTNPFYTYLVCYRVLEACQDVRATIILHTAQQLLHSYAGSIKDPTLRQSFFEQVPTYRGLLVT